MAPSVGNPTGTEFFAMLVQEGASTKPQLETFMRKKALLTTFAALSILFMTSTAAAFGTPSACDSAPCQHGGTCHEIGANAHSCDCPAGYSGFNCETEDPCAGLVCHHGGQCYVQQGAPHCSCTLMWVGPTCELPAETYACDPPCQNGGVCAPDDDAWYCVCPAGFTGEHCENFDCSADVCNPNPCQNGGTCTDNGNGSYTCNCPPGTSGSNCQIEEPPTLENPCNPDPCKNGGDCIIGYGTHTCICPPGYSGTNCELADNTTTNPCDSSPCQNGGSCTDSGNGSYSCSCQSGYSGTNCETYGSQPNPCETSPCQNAGVCSNSGNGSYSCSCTPGYSGTNCETADNTTNPCDPSPCQNGGSCTDSGNGSYSCSCPSGYSGTNCEIADNTTTNPCDPSPCQNGGSCADSGNGSYSCSCPSGYSGANCETYDDPCATDNTAPTFDPSSLDPRTVMGACGAEFIAISGPNASDNCSQVTVECQPVAANSFGGTTTYCTATDSAGNNTTTPITVNVLAPLRIGLQSPLADDNVADNVQTDADVANRFNVGQTIALNVQLYDCNGTDVTSNVQTSVSLSVAISAETNQSEPSTSNELDDNTDAGDSGGMMYFWDNQLRYRLATDSDFVSGGAQYSALITVSYISAPTLDAGAEDVRLISR